MENIYQILGVSFSIGHLSEGVPTSYNLYLLGFSYVFAFIAGYVGLLCVPQIATSKSLLEKTCWRLTGAFVIGAGAWAMHFMSLLALETHDHSTFDAWLTTISAVPVFALGLATLLLLSLGKKSVVALLLGLVVFVVAFDVMHFIGVAAMRMKYSIVYNVYLLGISNVIGIALLVAALYIKPFVGRLVSNRLQYLSNIICAAVIGLALAAMNYFAEISAESFPLGTTGNTTRFIDTGQHLDNTYLFILMAVLMMAFIAMIALVFVVRKISTHKSLFSLIIDNTDEGYLICDGDGIVSLFSPGAEQIFGRPAKEVVGNPLHVILPPEMWQWHGKKIAASINSPEMSVMGLNREITAYKKDGQDFPLEINVTRVGHGHGVVFCASMRDITVRRAFEDERETVAKEVAIALEKQKETNQLQRDFITMASHEFRTPLAIIDSKAQLLLLGKGPVGREELDDKIDKIRNAVARMRLLMESFLVSAKNEDQAMQLAREDIDLGELVSRVCKETAARVSSHTIDAGFDGLPETIKIDPILIAQVIENLLSNAIKYSKSSNSVEVKGFASEGLVHISVRDFGIGIPTDEIKSMGTRFFRASTSRGIAGTGIGLNLTKKIIERHGGSLGIESEVGEGTTFIMTLPINAEQPEDDLGSNVKNGFIQIKEIA